MKHRLETILYSAGALQHYCGYSYLVRAVDLVQENPDRIRNICKEVYHPIALEYNTSIGNVHKDIRTVRDAFWKCGGKKVIRDLTGCCVWEYQKPYPKELIGILAHTLDEL